jgi:hypothetical protein
VVETDELVHLDEGLAALPELQRRALLLREWQGLSYREIRHELELSQGAVEQLIFRARRSLARELTEPSKRRRFGGTISVVSLLPRLKAFLFDDPDGVVSLAKIALSTGTLVGAAAVATGAVHAPADDHHRNVVVPPRNTVPVVVRARPAAAVTADGLRHVRLDSRRGGWVARAAPEISAAHVPVGETPTSTALAPSVTAPQASSPKAEPAFAPPGTDADAPANARDIAPRTANGSTNAQGSPTPARHTVPPATDAKAGVRPAGSPAGSARREHATPPSATPATAPAKQSPNGGASGSPDVPSDNGGAPVADGQAAEANAASAQAVADTGASASAGDPASPRQSAGPPPSNAMPRPLDPE